MGKNKYILNQDAFNQKDIVAAIKVLKSKQITMSNHTLKFEKYFAKINGSKYAVMVNSGSSANLLAAFASGNPYRKNKFKMGDEALIPALCWSTSLWPLVQAGLKPKFIDIEKKNLNINFFELKKKITNKTKVIMLVHVLGLSCSQLDEIVKICKKKNIILIEDTCESLGSTFKNKKLGTFGDFGTYSFYYSHQITSGEGGMVVCNTVEDYNILKSLRSHGWTRGLNMGKKYKKLDKNFTFYNMGFNLRPLDLTAVIGNNQLKRFDKFKKNRSLNRKKIIDFITKDKSWNNQFEFQEITEYCQPSWFGLPILISKSYLRKKEKFLKYLNSQGIETRPIISGDFTKQPAIKKFNLNKENKKFPVADDVGKRGFFIGLHSNKSKDNLLKYVATRLLKIEEI